MLSNEQIQKIKTHLLDQLVSFPEDQRKFMKHKILSMTNNEVEEFIKENKLKHLEDPSSPQIAQQPSCIFCSILEGKIPSYKIYESQDSIGILEINPLSKGHALLVPKKHLEVKDLEEKFLEEAKKLSETIASKYSPQEIKMGKTNILGHSLIEIIPIYGDEKERKRAEPEELEKMKKELETEPPKEEVKQSPPPEKPKSEPVTEKKEIIKLKPRIP
jgi:diadenosine tetraphosphate (Ap4A) HIT family hydrolase